MLYHILFPIEQFISGFNIFRYITFRAIFAALFALLFTIVFGHFFIAFINLKIGKLQVVRRFTPLSHQKKSGTPSMGGIIILVAITLASLAAADLSNPFILASLAAFWAFASIGFVDDSLKIINRNGKGLNSKIKLASQFVVSLAIGAFLFAYSPNPPPIHPNNIQLPTQFLSFPFLKNSFLNLGYSYWILIFLVLIGSSNAVNLTDGLDGLATGLATFVFIAFIIFSYVSGHKLIAQYLHIPFIPHAAELTVFISAITGASIGFLWYNSHPAQIFLGDTGSLAIGGTIGFLALILKIELLLPIIGGVFVLEAASVIIQVFSRKFFNKRFFKLAPLHHHFELIGWHENKIISRFWIIGALLTLVGIASLKVR